MLGARRRAGRRGRRADDDVRGHRPTRSSTRAREPCFVDVPGRRQPRPATCSTRRSRDQRHQGRRVSAVMAVDLLGRCRRLRRGRGGLRAPRRPAARGRRRGAGRVVRTVRPAGPLRSGGGAVLQRQQDHDHQRRRDAALATTATWPSTRASCRTQAREPVAHYEHRHIGYNYRLSNILAALGRAQLARLDEMIARRREIRAPLPRPWWPTCRAISVFQDEPDGEDNCWLTALLVDPDLASRQGRRPDATASRPRGIEARPLWKPDAPAAGLRRRPGLRDR